MNYFLKNMTYVKQVLFTLSGVCLLLTSAQVQSNLCDPTQFESTPVKRFEVTNLGTVIDLSTNLEWKVCAEARTWQAGQCIGLPILYNWKDALNIPETLNATEGFAGQHNWRLPNIKELATIVEYRCRYLLINQRIFVNLINEGVNEDFEAFNSYWSSSPSSQLLNSSWLFDFRLGSMGVSNRILGNEVRLVRDVP